MNSGLTQAIDTQPIDEHMTFGSAQSSLVVRCVTSSNGDFYVPVKELLSGRRQASMQQALHNYMKKGFRLDDIATELNHNNPNSKEAQCIPRCLALALSVTCHDYRQLYEFLEAEPEYRFSVRTSISTIHEHKPIDVLTLYKAAGVKKTADFCTLFNITLEDLAVAIVVADDLEAAQILMHELWEAKWLPDHLTNAIARLPFNPLSRIGGWRYPQGHIPESEMALRYENQTGMFKDPADYAMYSVTDPLTFGPEVRLQLRHLQGVDHGLRLLPGFQDFLCANNDECCALLFKNIQSNNRALSPELFRLATELVVKLVNAGMDRSKLLFVHTLEKRHGWFKDYQRGLLDHLPRMARCEALVDSLIAVDGTRNNTPTKDDLFKILVRLESIEDLVSACDTDEKRRAVHGIIPDQRLVESLSPNAREDLLQSDLGL